MDSFDVVVVGGGAAGLSGALTLARARRSVLVVDGGPPRNAAAAHAHNFLTRDGVPPLELLALGRKEIEGYGARLVEGRAVTASRLDDGRFRVSLADGSAVVARRLLVASGLTDVLPDVPGVAERFGRMVLHCPYCHGWEARDKAIGVLGSVAPLAMHQALLWRQLTDDVVMFQHTVPSFSAEELAQLAARGIRVVSGLVSAVDDEGVRLADGRVVARDHVVVASRMEARSELLASLGLSPVDQEMAGQVIGSAFASDPTGATEVAGVWVAGNVTSVSDQIVTAAAAGLRAAAMINSDLVTEDTQRALA